MDDFQNRLSKKAAIRLEETHWPELGEHRDKTISEVGEKFLLSWLGCLFSENLPGVVLGSGDDCAVMEIPEGRQLVVTTDTAVEDVHFRRDWSNWLEIGIQVMVQNLSDIAAMGAEPLAVVIALTAPGTLTVGEFCELAGGFKKGEEMFRCQVAGGNLSRGEKVVINVTALGTVEKGQFLTRKGAQVGDSIWVTGRLGYQRARLLARQNDWEVPGCYTMAFPRVIEARSLRDFGAVKSILDLSDGLHTDLPRLLDGVGAVVYPHRIHRTLRLEAWCERHGLDVNSLLVWGGEDYELLFTSPHGDDAPWKDEYEEQGGLVRWIGEVVEGEGVRYLDEDGEEWTPTGEGFEHF